VTAPLLLLDSASLYFRAFYGVPASLTAADGTPVNAVRGLLDTIARVVTQLRPRRLVACWDDDWRPAFRVAALPSYKAHRLAADGTSEAVPEELATQVPLITEILAALGVARLGSPGFEADDVIATLATREGTMPGGVDIVTGDRDLFQLVDDTSGTRVRYHTSSTKDFALVDEDYLHQRYGITGGAMYEDMAILVGDPSDGLPGVRGIGEKTAVKLLAAFGDLDSLLDAAHDPDSALTSTQRSRLVAAGEYVSAARRVVSAVRDVPLPDLDARLPTRIEETAIAELAERWNLGSPLRRAQEALNQA